MAEPDELRALLKLAKERRYPSLFYVIRAILNWDRDPRENGASLAAQARNGMVDVRDLLMALPGIAGSTSVREYVLGYEPVGDDLPKAGAEALAEWNGFQGRALELEDVPDFPKADDLRGPVGQLLEDIARFVAKRTRLAEYDAEARKYRKEHPLLQQ